MFLVYYQYQSMQIFHTYNIVLMKNNQLWAILLVVLLVSTELGAKCET